MEQKQESEANADLIASMKKWESTKRSVQLEALKKSRSARRKELQHWVNLLLNNLRKINTDIEQQGEVIQNLFTAEDDARKEFEAQKKRGIASEEQVRREIAALKTRLQVLIEKNQEENFAKFERIQELIDEQEVKMIEKQSQMHEHANCLEMLLKVLAESEHFKSSCRYSDILKVTPVKDDYFTWTTTGQPVSNRSQPP